MTQDVLEDLMPDEADLLYEEELLRNPTALRLWIKYIEARHEAPAKKRFLLYERAIQKLPGSYKLWHKYLQERARETTGLNKESLNNCYERSLVTMHKMPRIWIEYIESLMAQGYVTRTRRALDRALAALPVTQHDRLWIIYLKFVTQPDIPMDTAFRVYRRYLKMEPGHREEYIAYLNKNNQWSQAAKELATCVNDDTFRSIEGKSKHSLWLELCDIVTKHPDEVQHLDIDAIIRGGIRKFTNEVGRLWCALADYYIRQGLFERARDIYQEGVESVITVRDFTLIFEALTSFEQALIETQMEQLGDDMPEEPSEPEGDGADFLLSDDKGDIDLRLERLEWLYAERPKLLNSVMLRQNPHNVAEWHNRAHLFEGDLHQQIRTYTEAVKTVDPNQAVGKPHTLWCAFAHFYERHGDISNARTVFEKATQAPFAYVDDLSHVWCQWAEMELKHHNYQRAMQVLTRAVEEPAVSVAPKRNTAEAHRALPPQAKVHRSQRIWSMYVDLVEALGTFKEAREVYDKMIDNKVASAQVILNYAEFLANQRYWEDSFQVYEKGVANFKYPHVEVIWKAYLTSFVDRHKGTKLERARDLFQQACEDAPPDKRKQFYLMHADFEEKYGLARHCFSVYERAAKAVPREERAEVYRLFADRAQKLNGIPKVREVYQMACEAQPPHEVPDRDVIDLAVEFAGIEKTLHEIDRARAIFVFASAIANERKYPDFWQKWEQFEGLHGNPSTWREMTRIRRSVAAQYSNVHFNTTNVEAAVELPEDEDPMAALEAAAVQKQALPGFVAGGVQGGGGKPASEEPAAKKVRVQEENPEEIDIGDDDDD